MAMEFNFLRTRSKNNIKSRTLNEAALHLGLRVRQHTGNMKKDWEDLERDQVVIGSY